MIYIGSGADVCPMDYGLAGTCEGVKVSLNSMFRNGEPSTQVLVFEIATQRTNSRL